MDMKNRPITRAQRSKLKAIEDNGMVAYLEEALKSKLEGYEGQERVSKLFSKCSISKDQTREKIGGKSFVSQFWFYEAQILIGVESKLLAIEDSHQSGIRATSNKGQIDLFGVGNHEGQRSGQAKEKIMDFSRGEKSTKANKISQAQDNSIPVLELLNYKLWNKAKSYDESQRKGMEKELSISFEDISLSLSLNHFLLYHEFSFKVLKLFLELHASYVTLVGNVMVNPFTCDLAFDIDHMLKCSFPCAYLEKQLFVYIARIKTILP
ncbi:hypothetical protein M9H77_11761 [Catharanthus roseus]|uniref:Uncharacterized protein n=1 Tax=Catharanthus roseus TaxID=4058 RepID=A0ACC0BFN7_CATRO|nr:hypothetical protein M9H77_11761 [Catharanthus roseus]